MDVAYLVAAIDRWWAQWLAVRKLERETEDRPSSVELTATINGVKVVAKEYGRTVGEANTAALAVIESHRAGVSQ